MIYGVVDVYMVYQKSIVGGKDILFWVMGNNGQMISWFGFKGVEDLGGGYCVSFNLEIGFDFSIGGLQNSYCYFDCQFWVGFGGGFGEVCVGWQNSVMFFYLGNMDVFGVVIYGLVYNNFVNWLVWVDNDISYILFRFVNIMLELYYLVGECVGSIVGNVVYQIGMQIQQGLVYVGSVYFNVNNSININSVKQFMLGGNVDYGSGKVYLVFFCINEVILVIIGNVFINLVGKYDLVGVVVGNMVGDYYNIYSFLVDYCINVQIIVGVGGGFVKDVLCYNNNVCQFSFIVNYDLFKCMWLYVVVLCLINQNIVVYCMIGVSFMVSQVLSLDVGVSEIGV